MVRLKPWQWVVLATPIASIISFLLISAGMQIHEWGINWIWGVVTLLLVGWRWLLVKWTRPAVDQLEAVMAEVNKELESASDNTTVQSTGNDATSKAEAALQEILTATQNDPPIWEDWSIFGSEARTLSLRSPMSTILNRSIPCSTFMFPKLTR
jgi:hypothetical protein